MIFRSKASVSLRKCDVFDILHLLGELISSLQFSQAKKNVDFPLVFQLFLQHRCFEYTWSSWMVLSLSWALLGRSWAILGRSWRLLACSWGGLGRSWRGLGRSWGHLGWSWGRSWPVLGRSWAVLGGLGCLLGSFWELLRPSESALSQGSL